MSSADAIENNAELDPRSPEVDSILHKVQKMLDEYQAGKALDLLRRTKQNSPWLTNAIGVCQLRLGNGKNAVDAFRGLVLSGLILRKDVPTVFVTNYALSLLAANNLNGGLAVLDELRDETNATVKQIRSAVQCWKSKLTLFQKMDWYLGGQPNRPLDIDFPLGSLE